MRGMLFGVLGLTLLQALLSGRSNASRLGEAGTAVSGVLAAIIDPDKPLVPDFRPGHGRNDPPGSTTSASSSTSATTTTPAVAAPTPVAVPATGSRTYVA